MRLYKLAIEINADSEVSYFAGYIDDSKPSNTHTTVITAEQFHDMLLEVENNATQPMDNDDSDSDE